ncbi:MAG: hypothetical protein BroJett038_32980 [Chloroflexota bacterium]|nr:MAG: hypothetical protein BroJett038_32980 [Chloroflexota bacterium]
MGIGRLGPLERRGWSLRNTNPTLDGDDGAWLGTGWLVRAIVDAVEFLPADQVPAALRAALTDRMLGELKLMQRDWQTKRPWYVSAEAVQSNQWILPNEAMVRACLFLGRGRSDPAYELGVQNLLRSLDYQGAQGEFVEGLHYSSISVTSLYSIARATARAGDRRLIAHPFLRKYPTWLAHHFQPGGFIINCFDAPATARGMLQRDQALFAVGAIVSGNPHALWSLQTRARFGPTVDGILAACLPPQAAEAPPLFAAYPQATRLNWRSSWDDDQATGLWLRGGHSTDFHDHMDRGHVNFVIGNQPLLIEAGIQSYATPTFHTHMWTVAGHNVLQIGSAPPERLLAKLLLQAGQILNADERQAPITVERMDEDGGSASVDLSRCYRNISKWVRHVEWDRKRVIIKDTVELPADNILQFRWHLGVPMSVARHEAPGEIIAGPVRLSYQASSLVSAVVEGMPDATLERGVITEHACVVVRTVDRVRALELVTQVGLVDAIKE